MMLSAHTLIRCQQRGIKEEDIRLILELGRKTRRPGGALEVTAGRRIVSAEIERLKRRIKRLQRLPGKAVLISGDGNTVITTYHLRH